MLMRRIDCAAAAQVSRLGVDAAERDHLVLPRPNGDQSTRDWEHPLPHDIVRQSQAARHAYNRSP